MTHKQRKQAPRELWDKAVTAREEAVRKYRMDFDVLFADMFRAGWNAAIKYIEKESNRVALEILDEIKEEEHQKSIHGDEINEPHRLIARD